MKTLFKTVLTTKRHREIGYFEDSDFGSIELIRLNPEEKELIVSFNDKGFKDDKLVNIRKEFIRYKNEVFVKITQENMHLRQSREDDKTTIKKQGKFSDQSAIKLMLDLRSRSENDFSNAANYQFIIIGNTLYQHYSWIGNLKVTVASNLMFSCWLSIDIESHGGKSNFPLSKLSFEKVFRKEKRRFEAAKPKEGVKRGDGHVHFSYPTSIVWGNKYNK